MKEESNIYFHSECDFEVDSILTLEPWVKGAIKEEKKELGVINYVFCNDESLLEKNQTYLNHNTYTDIITFDYSEKNCINGDLYISVDRVKENALKFAVPFAVELKRVMIHGILHLIGYKDKSEKEQKLMREKEDFYLKKIT